jgi:hypothetical protein
VTGTPRAGATLTVQPGTWAGIQPITHRYAWRRYKPSGGGCVDIAGATGRTSGLVLLASNDITGYYWHNRRAVP